MNIWTKLAMFSFFETDRLYLRPFFFSDSQDFHEIASNPENLQFIFPTQASLEESQYTLANYFMKSPWECGQFVTRKSTNDWFY